MESNFQYLPLNYHPQQIEKKYNEITISSKFDSGNILSVENYENKFTLTISPDCHGIEQEYIYRTWFNFKVKGAINKKLDFHIKSMNNHIRIFQDGYKIVYYRNNNPEFDSTYAINEEYEYFRLKSDYSFEVKEDKTLEIKFSFDFKNDLEVYFSFCYPWSYTKNQKFIDSLENETKMNKEIYFHRENLTFSKEKRIIDLITISSIDGITKLREPTLKNLFPDNKVTQRCYSFSKEKQFVFITARVHPGETPSSFLMNGILKFLTDKNNIFARILRKFFVFKIIPMINVDGVYRGFYRYDTNSFNMNRHYSTPNNKIVPEIYAIKRLFMYYSQEKRIRYFFDLHGHVSSRGLFLYGNSMEYLNHVENCLFPKIYEINCKYFNFDGSIFNEKSMKSKEKGDMFSKEGSSRVNFYRISELTHCYTIEASYFRGVNYPKSSKFCTKYNDKKVEDQVLSIFDFLKNHKICLNSDEINSNEELNNMSFESTSEDNLSNELYDVISYEKMGRDLLISILDYEEINPYSKIFNSEFKDLKSLRKFIAFRLVNEDNRFKNNLLNQNLAKDIQGLKKFSSIFEKISLRQEKNLIKSERGTKINLQKIYNPVPALNYFRTQNSEVKTRDKTNSRFPVKGSSSLRMNDYYELKENEKADFGFSNQFIQFQNVGYRRHSSIKPDIIGKNVKSLNKFTRFLSNFNKSIIQDFGEFEAKIENSKTALITNSKNLSQINSNKNLPVIKSTNKNIIKNI